MAPGDNIAGSGKLTWTAVKNLCTPGEIDRLACLAVAYINGAEPSKVYHEAAQQYGGKIKPESYKRGLWVISKKIKEAGGVVGSGVDDGTGGLVGEKAKGGAKRKAGGESPRDEEKPKSKRAKKAAKEVKNVVKAEKDESVDADLDDVFD